MASLTMKAGDDREITITSTLDLTGCDVYFTAKVHREDTDAESVISKSTADGIVVDENIATVTLDSADTDGLGEQSFPYDVRVRDSEDKVHTLATGRIHIQRAVLEDVPA